MEIKKNWKLNDTVMPSDLNRIEGNIEELQSGISEENFTTAEKQKLENIETGATATIIENSLTSDSTTAALSAKQGKLLNELIEETKGDISDKLLDVKKIMENTLKGGILNALLTGFTKTSDSGDITSSDTLKKALNKLQNKGKIVCGSYTGREKETVDTTQRVTVGIRPDFLVVIGGHVSSSTFYGQVERTAISIMEGFISIKSGYQIYKPYFEITSNGFTVSNHNRAYMNQQDYIYRYIAIQV